MTLVSVAAIQLGAGYVEPTLMNLEMTFGDLDGKKLVFQGEGRPFTRCLNFQAKQAFNRAQKMKWVIPEGLSWVEYGSDKGKHRLNDWIAVQRAIEEMDNANLAPDLN